MPGIDKSIESPLVSVYIVNHNYAQYIEQAIQSVLNQTLQDFELIIIDDGSTDHSRDIIERYAGHEKIVTIFQQNNGLNVTNNIALRIARGRYIIRLDADDWFDQHALHVLSGVLDRNPDTGLVFPDYYLVDPQGEILDFVRRHNFDDVTLMDQPAHGACTLIRTACLSEIGGYDEEFRRQDGYELWIRFVQHYGVQNVNLPLFYYRQHPVSLTKNEERLLETRARILAKHASYSEHKHGKAVAIVPVRGQITEPGSRALRLLGGKPLIEWTIDTALAAERISDVIVSSPDQGVLSHVRQLYGDQVIVISREAKMARLNSYVDEAILHALEQYVKTGVGEPEVVTTLYIESPFRLPRHIDSAIDVLALFSTDSVVAVRPETDVFYQHNGSGLQLVRSGTQLRLEADELYREVGDMRTVRTEYLKEHRSAVGGRVGHIVMDEKAAFSVLSEWDWEVAELYVEYHAKIKNLKG